jgi:Ca2+/Na+ antiporter
VGPLLYREDAGTDLVAFQADGSGAITHAFIASFPTLALERVPWLESARVQRVVLAFGGAVFLLTIWSAVGRLLRQWLERRTPDPLLAGHSLIVWTALADLGFLAGVAFLVSNATALMTGSPTVFEWLLALPVLAAVLASIAAIVAVKQWIDRSGSATARLRYAAVVIVALIFTWSLNEWNLLGWKL